MRKGSGAEIDFPNAERRLLLAGSPEVIERYLEFQDLVSQDSLEAAAVLERLLLAMRKDLGERNVGLDNGRLVDLLRVRFEET